MGNFYYQKVGPASWRKSDRPGRSGVWLTQKAYDAQIMIERDEARQKAKAARGNVRRQLRNN